MERPLVSPHRHLGFNFLGPRDTRLALMAKNTAVEGGLVLTLTRWRKREQLVPETLPKFGEIAKIVAKPPDQNVLVVER